MNLYVSEAKHLPFPTGTFSPKFRKSNLVLPQEEKPKEALDFSVEEGNQDLENFVADVSEASQASFDSASGSMLQEADDMSPDTRAVVDEALAGVPMEASPIKRKTKKSPRMEKTLNPRDAGLKSLGYTQLKNMIVLSDSLLRMNTVIPREDSQESRLEMRVTLMQLRDALDENSEKHMKTLMLGLPDVNLSARYLHLLMEALATPPVESLPNNVGKTVKGYIQKLGQEVVAELHEKFSGNYAVFRAVGSLFVEALSEMAEMRQNFGVYKARASRHLHNSLSGNLKSSRKKFENKLQKCVAMFLLKQVQETLSVETLKQGARYLSGKPVKPTEEVQELVESLHTMPLTAKISKDLVKTLKDCVERYSHLVFLDSKHMGLLQNSLETSCLELVGKPLIKVHSLFSK